MTDKDISMNFVTLKELKNIAGKRVLLRLDLNVPVANNRVADDFRLRSALPTLEYLRVQGAKVIIIGHIEGETRTLRPVYERLSKLFPLKAFLTANLETEFPSAVGTLQEGEAVLCENLRLYPGEKANDEKFAAALSALGEVFVNEAFSVSHRAHASIVGVPKLLPSFAGFRFALEVEELSKAFRPEHPALFILGGAKFETKLPLLQKFLGFYDYVFVSGALANDFFKAKGFSIGASRVSAGIIDLRGLIGKGNLILPSDVVVKNPSGTIAVSPDAVQDSDSIMDAGPKTIELLEDLVRRSKFVLWNGPLGNYEAGFRGPTEELAKYIATNSIHSVMGGGDTLAAVAKLNLTDKFDFVSTAGGAMLQFLATGTLPGIAALEVSLQLTNRI